MQDTLEDNKNRTYTNIAVIGSSGAIGHALVKRLNEFYPNAHIHAFSQRDKVQSTQNIHTHTIDYNNEDSMKEASLVATRDSPLDLLIISTGMLHDQDNQLMPERSLRDLSFEKFERLFKTNSTVPAMLMKHFLPKLRRDGRSVCAALSARIGSISDNNLGGWYAYRASKTALNMILKNASIELARTHKQSIVIGLHPGTVKSDLSKPFQKNVPENKLFTPEYSSERLLNVINQISNKDTGKCFGWDGKEIEA